MKPNENAKPEDEVKLTLKVSVQPTDSTPRSAEDETPRLVVVEGMTPGLTVAVKGPLTTIGRDAENDLVLASATVSKNHARVIREDVLFYLEDMESTNGVSVNGKKLQASERRPLYHGDSIQISDHLVLFCQPGTFSDEKRLSTIRFDAARVKADAEEALKELPTFKRPQKPKS